jgi:two-component system chemotaxis sensor kinase CheA
VLRRAGDNLVRLERDVDRLVALQAGDRRQLARAARQLDEGVRRVRMLPFAEACQGLERSVRDLATAGGKDVELVIEGGDVEMDRSILEG